MRKQNFWAIALLLVVAFFTSCGSHRALQRGTVQCEDTCRHTHGVDVSHYQGSIDWRKLAKHAHMHYAYIKATEGANFRDPYYEHNLKQARKHGVMVGSYIFFRPQVPLLAQMDNLFHTVNPKKQDLIPLVDVETTGSLSTDAFQDSLRIFLDMVSAAYRCKPLVYVGQNFYNRYLSSGVLNNYPLMVANYSRRPLLNDGRNYVIWQYTANGAVVGIRQSCDKSRIMEGFSLDMIRR
jgi:lysozyme